MLRDVKIGTALLKKFYQKEPNKKPSKKISEQKKKRRIKAME